MIEPSNIRFKALNPALIECFLNGREAPFQRVPGGEEDDFEIEITSEMAERLGVSVAVLIIITSQSGDRVEIRTSVVSKAIVGDVSTSTTVPPAEEAPPSDGGTDPPDVGTNPPSGPSSVSIAPSGYGADSDFGQGGNEYNVNTLADSGPGSLRAALAKPGPRRITFSVEGVMRAASPLNLGVGDGRVSILGSSAPGKGFRIQNSRENHLAVFKSKASDVLVENIGLYGNVQSDNKPVEAKDVVSLGIGAHDVCFSQCTIAWGIDENIQVWDGKKGASGENVSDIIFQYCLVAEALSQAGHEKGEHSKGLLIGEHGARVSVHHSLFTGNMKRNPRVHANLAQIVNNVIVASGNTFRPIAIASTQDEMLFDVEGNLVIGDTGDENGCLLYGVFNDGTSVKVHLSGNIGPGRRSNSQPEEDFCSRYGRTVTVPAQSRFCTPVVKTHDVGDAALEAFVRARVGCKPGNRSDVDKRLLAIAPGAGGIVNAPPEGDLF